MERPEPSAKAVSSPISQGFSRHLDATIELRHAAVPEGAIILLAVDVLGVAAGAGCVE